MKHYDFLNEQILFYTGEKHADLYNYFSQEYKIQYHELFVLAATLGFVNQKREKREGVGKEFRSNYLDDQEKTSLYTILLSDDEFGLDIDGFSKKELWPKYRSLLEEYAIGGLDFLIEGALEGRVKPGFIDENYQYYARDIINFLLDQLDKNPFSF